MTGSPRSRPVDLGQQLAAVRAMLDPDRLAVAGALAHEPVDVDRLVDRTGLDRRRVLGAIATLRAADLVSAADDGTSFRLAPERLRELARQLEEPVEPMDPSIGFGMTDDERAVLERLFRGRSLVDIPTNATRRRIVLERLALEFEPGRTYRESTVVEVLRRFHPDHAALRRHLVDEELLERRDGEYWRAGGRVLDRSDHPVEEVTFRTFQERDRAALIELWHRCGLVRPQNDPGSDIDLKIGVDPDGLIIAFERRPDGVESVVGSIMVGFDGHRGWINYLAVDPDRRRQGLGRHLMRRAEDLLLERGCPKVNLQVRHGNEAAIAFYERIGYADDGVTGMGRRPGR